MDFFWWGSFFCCCFFLLDMCVNILSLEKARMFFHPLRSYTVRLNYLDLVVVTLQCVDLCQVALSEKKPGASEGGTGGQVLSLLKLGRIVRILRLGKSPAVLSAMQMVVRSLVLLIQYSFLALGVQIVFSLFIHVLWRDVLIGLREQERLNAFNFPRINPADATPWDPVGAPNGNIGVETKSIAIVDQTQLVAQLNGLGNTLAMLAQMIFVDSSFMLIRAATIVNPVLGMCLLLYLVAMAVIFMSVVGGVVTDAVMMQNKQEQEIAEAVDAERTWVYLLNIWYAMDRDRASDRNFKIPFGLLLHLLERWEPIEFKRQFQEPATARVWACRVFCVVLEGYC